MADLMTFQNTVEEFMEKYKIVDTEQVYTNGAELVPIFRMRQWFEHTDAVPVVRCADCKHWHREIYNDIEYFNYSSCDLNHYGDGHNFYCADGRRKEGGADV